MNMRRMVLGSVLALGLLAGGATVAQAPPVENIDPARHPNLYAAQHLVEQAFNKISAAQAANDFDMNGHAVKAKELLDQANRELKAAAIEANKNRR